MHHNLTRLRRAKFVLGVALALFPLIGFPLGLGKLKVHSTLNAPLNAEIEFTSISESELKSLKTNMASRADFDAAGAARLPFLSQIKFETVKRSDGRYVLQLTTDEQVDEPFLHFLIQIEWSGGRLIRQYTALIDPPQYIGGQPRDIESPRTITPAPIDVVPEPATYLEQTKEPSAALSEPEKVETPVAPELETQEPIIAEETPAPTETAQEQQPVSAKESKPVLPVKEPMFAESSRPPQDVTTSKVEPLDAYVPETQPSDAEVVSSAPSWEAPSEHQVKWGDTLSGIAKAMNKDPQVSLEQMIVALYKANPDAFFRNNVNNLYAGKILKVPERGEIISTTRDDAAREVKAHYDVWKEYKLKLASAGRSLKIADSSPSEAPAAEVAAPSEKSTSKQEKLSKTDKSPGDLLQIVRSDLETKKTTPDKKVAEAESAANVEQVERSALAERVATLEESIESRQIENKQLSDKIGMVRNQLKNEARLLEFENQSLAQKTQKKEEPAKPALAEPPLLGTVETKPAPAPVVPKPEVVAPPVKAPETKQAETPAPAAPAEQGLVATIIEMFSSTMWLLVLVGGALFMGALIFVIYWRRRVRSIAEFEESILATDAISGDSSTTGRSAATTPGDVSFLSDFSQGTSSMGHIRTDDVDPIAEAEVYLAYGRDETAEEILKEASAKHPERHEIKQKLLEIYHQRNDVAAFELLAEELYAALGGRGGKVWDKIEEMGRKVSPNNPMFRGGAPSRREAGASPQPSSTPPAKPSTTDDGPGDVTDLAEGMDFEVDIKPAGTKTATADAGLDFDPDADAELPKASVSDAGEKDDGLEALSLSESSEPEIDSSIEFEPSAGSAPIEEGGTVDIDAMAEKSSDSSGIEWEPGASASPDTAGGNGAAEPAESPGQWDETATKLDLARAYIDMGDTEGARSILDEVLAEGNESQKKQAADLAAQIS